MRLNMHWRCCVLLCWGWYLFYSSSIQAQTDQLNWYVRDWPPVNILHGPQRGQGAYDLMLVQLINRLPQYQHQVRLSNLTMRQQMMQQQVPHCLFGLLKTAQRQTFLRFSEPIAAIPNLQLVARADHPLWQQLGRQTEVSANWLARQPWLGLAERGRTYPEPLDKLAAGFVQVTATDTPLLHFLIKGRADYLLEYPDRVHFLAAELQGGTLRSIPISDLPKLSEVYVACSLTAGSKQQISDINQQLALLRQQPEFRDALSRWLSPSSQQLVADYMQQSSWFDGAATQMISATRLEPER